MSKKIIGASINLSGIDKSRLIKGKKGTYGDFTIHLNSEVDKYGNNGFITQQRSKEERDANQQMEIIGKVRILWEDNAQPEPDSKNMEDSNELPF